MVFAAPCKSALPLPTREKGGDESDPPPPPPPPQSGGACDPDSGTERRTSIPAPWGRSRPHLSLREGSETAPQERR